MPDLTTPDLEPSIENLIYKTVMSSLNTTLIEIKLLEDMLSDKEAFIKIYHNRDTSTLTSIQLFILSKIIVETVSYLMEKTTAEYKKEEE